MTWRMMMGMALAATLGLGVGTASAGIVYGLNDDGHIFRVDTVSGHETQLTTSPTSGSANGLAYDRANKALYFRSPASGKLYTYDTTTAGSVATLVNVAGSGGTANGATFWGGSYWFIKNGTTDLWKVDLTSASPTYQLVANLQAQTAGGDALTTFSLGDMAVDATGMLYISSTQGFYSANLGSLSGTSLAATRLGNSTGGALQITFQPNGSLIGQDHGTGKWYDVSTSNGGRTEIVGLTTSKFRDLAGAPVPEPASVALMGIGVGAAVVFGRRRLKNHA